MEAFNLDLDDVAEQLAVDSALLLDRKGGRLGMLVATVTWSML